MLRTHPHPAGGLRRQTMKGVAMGSAPSRNFGRFLLRLFRHDDNRSARLGMAAHVNLNHVLIALHMREARRGRRAA